MRGLINMPGCPEKAIKIHINYNNNSFLTGNYGSFIKIKSDRTYSNSRRYYEGNKKNMFLPWQNQSTQLINYSVPSMIRYIMVGNKCNDKYIWGGEMLLDFT